MEEKKVTTELIENLTKPVSEDEDKISVGDLLQLTSSGGFPLIFLILCLPIAIPIPTPLPTILSFPIAIFGMQMFFGLKSVWLPKRLKEYSFKRTSLSGVVEKCAPFLRKIEMITRKRLYLFDSEIAQRVIGFLIFLSSFLIVLPIPFSHTAPSIGILLISIGILNKDGLFVIVGIFFCLLGFCLVFILAFASKAVILYIIKIKRLLF